MKSWPKDLKCSLSRYPINPLSQVLDSKGRWDQISGMLTGARLEPAVLPSFLFCFGGILPQEPNFPSSRATSKSVIPLKTG